MAKNYFNQQKIRYDGGRTHISDPLLSFGFDDIFQGVHEIEEMIKTDGVDILWYKSIQCPCRSEDTKQSKYDCEFCDGKGIKYLNPITVRTVILNRNLRQSEKNIGWADLGTAYVIWPTNSQPGVWDKIQDQTEIFVVTNEVLIKGELKKDGTTKEILNSISPIAIECCFDEDGIFYDNQSVKIVDRKIIWTNKGPKPKDNKKYSIRYTAHSEYVIMNSEPIFRCQGVNILPYRAIAQRMDLISYV